MNKLYLERPWGNMEQFTHNEKTTIKILNVSPNSKLSYQYHKKRDEFWKVISGECDIIIDDKKIKMKTGDEAEIKKGQKHRIITKKTPVRILEISFGNFDEEDIVRIEDEYNRVIDKLSC